MKLMRAACLWGDACGALSIVVVARSTPTMPKMAGPLYSTEVEGGTNWLSR
jgi:hypothetical protein